MLADRRIESEDVDLLNWKIRKCVCIKHIIVDGMNMHHPVRGYATSNSV